MKTIKFYKPISIQQALLSGDFVYQTSYQRWAYGQDNAIDSYNKWTYAELYGGAFKLEFIGGTINNVPIPKSQTGTSVTVNSATIVYRNDGYGLQPANYVDFINGILNQHNLTTRISATSGINPNGIGPYNDRFIARLNTTESFDLTFEETELAAPGAVDSLNSPYYYNLFIAPIGRVYDAIESSIPLNFYYIRSIRSAGWTDYEP